MLAQTRLTVKGGGDFIENNQLLCGHCNTAKGDRPIVFLIQTIKNREDQHTLFKSFK